MIGSEVERGGIIRHGAKMVSAVASATVPQFCVVVRKAYGAGLYAMGGPGFAPDATIALPTARIAVMGPEAAVNAVYANKIAQVEADEGEAARDEFIAARRAEYPRTSTSSGWRRTSSSTRSSSPRPCATSCSPGCGTPAAAIAASPSAVGGSLRSDGRGGRRGRDPSPTPLALRGRRLAVTVG